MHTQTHSVSGSHMSNNQAAGTVLIVYRGLKQLCSLECSGWNAPTSASTGESDAIMHSAATTLGVLQQEGISPSGGRVVGGRCGPVIGQARTSVIQPPARPRGCSR